MADSEIPTDISSQHNRKKQKTGPDTAAVTMADAPTSDARKTGFFFYIALGDVF